MNPVLYTSSLFVGLLTGYMIKRKPDMQLGGPLVERLIWLLSLLSVVVIVVWHRTFMQLNVVHDSESILAWFMYYKLVWAFFLGYTLYLCCTGRGGKSFS